MDVNGLVLDSRDKDTTHHLTQACAVIMIYATLKTVRLLERKS